MPLALQEDCIPAFRQYPYIYGGHGQCDKELRCVEFPLQPVGPGKPRLYFLGFLLCNRMRVTNSFRDEPRLQELVRYALGTRPGV